jgi:hypothetical protein
MIEYYRADKSIEVHLFFAEAPHNQHTLALEATDMGTPAEPGCQDEWVVHCDRVHIERGLISFETWKRAKSVGPHVAMPMTEIASMAIFYNDKK